MKTITVRNVRINASRTGKVRFRHDKKRRHVVAKTAGMLDLVVWQDLGGKFFASSDDDSRLVKAKTPQRAFAKAVKEFWGC
jgi:hypothetical protein